MIRILTWKKAVLIIQKNNLLTQGFIALQITINIKQGYFRLSPVLIKLIMKQCEISKNIL